jgi:hypothetical protein
MIRIWLDDIREMPKGYTHWCKTPESAIELLKSKNVEMIRRSFFCSAAWINRVFFCCFAMRFSLLV